jgi:hypothetical protein
MATARSLRLARSLWNWQPHSQGQLDWLLQEEARQKAAACGRRWGKSDSTAADIVLFALEHPNTTQIVTAPTDDLTKIIMGEVINRLAAIPGLRGGYVERKSPYWEIEFRDGSGLTSPTRIMARPCGVTGRGLRGRKAHRVICDEAGYIPAYILEYVIPALLADYDGQLVLLSTPNGLNHFYQAFQQGLDKSDLRSVSFQFPSDSNPYLPREWLADRKRKSTELAWAQEYLAQFLAGEGTVFRGVQAATEGVLWQEFAQSGHLYTFGVDWGRTGDYTVIAVYDLTLNQIVHLDRFTQIGFDVQLNRLQGLYERFWPVSIVTESNSMGGPQVERAQAMGLPVWPFNTSNATKNAIVDLTTLKLERGEMGLVADPLLIGEFNAYSCTRLPSGLMRYGAPEGQHDDIVMAVMLALYGASEYVPGGYAVTS